MRLTTTIARNAIETMCTRLMEFCDDTLWALKRLASLMVLGGGSECMREGEGPREGSRRLLKEDSLVMLK
jgi:hypothetical protein